MRILQIVLCMHMLVLLSRTIVIHGEEQPQKHVHTDYSLQHVSGSSNLCKRDKTPLRSTCADSVPHDLAVQFAVCIAAA